MSYNTTSFIIFQVDAATNREQIVCYCNHLTSFGSDLLVAPNPIDFDSVFSNFGSLAENVAVLALISIILGLYVIGVIWARRADRKDDLKVFAIVCFNFAGYALQTNQLTSLPLTSPRPTLFISPHLTSPHLTSLHLTLPYLTSPHLTSPHLTSPHLTSPRLTSPHLAAPRRASPRLAAPRRASPRLAAPYCTFPHKCSTKP